MSEVIINGLKKIEFSEEDYVLVYKKTNKLLEYDEKDPYFIHSAICHYTRIVELVNDGFKCNDDVKFVRCVDLDRETRIQLITSLHLLDDPIFNFLDDGSDLEKAYAEKVETIVRYQMINEK